MTHGDQIRTLTDHMELKELIYRFFHIIDVVHDVESILGCIAEDGVVDYRELGAPIFRGHDEMRPFFAEIFAKSQWQVHFLTNFHLTELSGDAAQARACLHGKGCLQDMEPYEAYAACEFAFKRAASGWKIDRVREYPVVPLSLPWASEPEPAG